MDVEFFVVGYFLTIAFLVLCGIGNFFFIWLPEYLVQRKATAEERATEWVNNHPIRTKVRRMR